MYVCMYICMYVSVTALSLFVVGSVSALCTYVCKYVCSYVCRCVGVSVYLYIDVCMHVLTYPIADATPLPLHAQTSDGMRQS